MCLVSSVVRVLLCARFVFSWVVLSTLQGKSGAVVKAKSPSSDSGALVEHVSSQVMQCIVLFYLGDLEAAMAFVPELSILCTCLPPWCAYLAAHGLYWCGRILALSESREDALRCMRQAKAFKKYPFNISTKVSKVLDSLERGGTA